MKRIHSLNAILFPRKHFYSLLVHYAGAVKIMEKHLTQYLMKKKKPSSRSRTFPNSYTKQKEKYFRILSMFVSNKWL